MRFWYYYRYYFIYYINDIIGRRPPLVASVASCAWLLIAFHCYQDQGTELAAVEVDCIQSATRRWISGYACTGL